MTTGSLNLPEDRTPSVLDRETIWKMVKRSTGLVVDSPDSANLDQEVDEKLTEEVQFFLNMGQCRPLFRLFSSFFLFQHQLQYQFQQYKLKKYGWCAWDSNQGTQYGKR